MKSRTPNFLFLFLFRFWNLSIWLIKFSQYLRDVFHYELEMFLLIIPFNKQRSKTLFSVAYNRLCNRWIRWHLIRSDYENSSKPLCCTPYSSWIWYSYSWFVTYYCFSVRVLMFVVASHLRQIQNSLEFGQKHCHKIFSCICVILKNKKGNITYHLDFAN